MVAIYALLGFQILVVIVVTYIIFVEISIIINWKNALPFVPASRKVAKQMTQLLDIQPEDNIIDIGSGWGTLIFQASKKGAIVTGIEKSRLLHISAVLRRLFHRDFKKISLIRDDVFNQDLRQYNKVIGWWIPEFVKKIQPKLTEELPPGATIISYMFPLETSDLWKETIHKTTKTGKDPIYQYEKQV